MSRPGRGPARYEPDATTAGGWRRSRAAVEGADEHGAGTVDLDRAVGAAVGLGHERRGQVVVEGERLAAVGPLVAPGPLAAGRRPPRRVSSSPLAGLVQEALAEHADVHEVGVVAERVAELATHARELHGADPVAASGR